MLIVGDEAGATEASFAHTGMKPYLPHPHNAIDLEAKEVQVEL